MHLLLVTSDLCSFRSNGKTTPSPRVIWDTTLSFVFAIMLGINLFILPTQCSSDFSNANDELEDISNGMSPSFFLRKEYSLMKPYQGSWSLSGSAAISGDDFVQLTANRQSQQGAIVSRLPVHIRHWEVRVHFRVHGPADGHCGDGFAFWYADAKGIPGARFPRGFPGPLFGGPSRFRGLAVLLDTYSNAHGPEQGRFHPYISAIVNNGSLEFSHDDDGEQKEPAGCTVNFRNRQGETHLAVRYVDDVLTVYTKVTDDEGDGWGGTSEPGIWRICFRVRGVRLPTHLMFGLSAMTGELVDNHEILAAKVYEVESTLNPDDYTGTRRQIVPEIDPLAKEKGELGDPLHSARPGSLTDAHLAASGGDSGGVLSAFWLALLAAAACVTGLAWARYRILRQRSRFY
ncbi:hypothetical protein BOX15_Mlig012728g1 [Macrostomum lignano]|uniref:L-type lectin-like domain-containing protein n=2 Tax=Macrostomum lignano TaxID=282301 RepID=A0A1I8H1G4_9PLAT|nr:hypothetical protein BOX15_Mlig012728g1 [Macrostomum lignano]